MPVAGFLQNGALAREHRPQPNDPNSQLFVDGPTPYLVTGDDSFQSIVVGTDSGGRIDHTAGVLTASSGLFVGFTGTGSSMYNLSGGTLDVANLAYIGVYTTGVVNQTGGVFFSTAVFVGFDASSHGALNLNGGILATGRLSIGAGVGVINLNGGTLRATTDNASFLVGGSANVGAGGAIIDSNSHNITIGQPLVHAATVGLSPDGGLTKNGAGTLSLTALNSYTGPTTINAGTLALNNTANKALSSTASITVNSGGTLLTNAPDQINHAAAITLNANSGPSAGATVAINTGGFSQTVGALTLSSTSVIDLSAGASILHFADSSAQPWTGTLAVWNWSGTTITGGGTDQLFFGDSPTGVTPVQLTQIQFYSDAGITPLGLAGYATSLNGEIVPDGLTAVPEPATWVSGVLLTATLYDRWRRRAARAASANARASIRA